MTKNLFKSITTIVSIIAAPLASNAQGNFSVDDIAQVSIIPGWRMSDGNHMAAIQIVLAEGWKTYWRAPGDAGIPPSFSWGGSRNLDSVNFHWPTPEVFQQNGMQSIGYDNVVVIPIELTPKRNNQDTISIRGEMQLGVCEDICIPITVGLSADLTATDMDTDAADTVINASLQNQPSSASQANVASVVCKIDSIKDGLRVTAKIDMPSVGANEIAVVELADKSVWVAPSSTKRSGRHLTLITEMVPPNAAPFLLARSDIRFTILAGENAVDIQGCTGG